MTDNFEAFENDDSIITLCDADGNDIDFIEIAGIAYNGSFYVILQPVELPDGMSNDEALVFEVSQGHNTDSFELVLDDEIIDGVFEEYSKLLDEMLAENFEEE